MASIYKKGKYIYLSWFDNQLNKTFNKSTKLVDNKENRHTAKIMAQKIQSKLDAQNKTLNELGLHKDTIGYAFDHFLQNNSFKHRSTIYEYNHFFKGFSEYFPATAFCSVINKISVEHWLVKVKGRNQKPNTKYVTYKVLKKFLNFLFEYSYIQVFKINSDLRISPEVPQLVVFDHSDMMVMLDNLRNKNNNFRVAILLLLYTGLRPSDIYRIKCEDIDLKKNVLRYYSQKINEPLMVPIHKYLIPVLQARVDEVKTGNIMDYQTISNMGKAVRRYFAQIHLDKKGYNMRTFRKTFISNANSNGIELALVSKLVGHKNIQTTAKHYNKIALSRQDSELNKVNYYSSDEKGDKSEENSESSSMN